MSARMVSRKRNFAAYAGPAASAWNAKRRKFIARKRILRPIPRSMRGFVRTSMAYARSSRGELKFFDTALSFLIDATAEVPATGQLVLIPQGTGESQRVGRLAQIKSLQIRATVTFAPGASVATTFGQGWIYVVLDTQCNGAAASITDVLTGNNISTALLNLDNSQRFRILKKIYVNCQPQAGVSTAFNGVGQQVECYKKLNIPIDYSSTTGAITEIRSNNIFLLAGTDGNSDDNMTVAGNARVRFTDH